MKLFSRHYGTERFFIMIALCFSLLVGLTGYGGVIEHNNNRDWISTTAVYTWQYTWSRTGSMGQVVGMFTDTSRSAAFVLLKNDAAMTSVSAQSYQVFMKGRDEALQNNPVLTVFVYGPTGYVGLYFKDTAGFRNQVYSLIIRNDSAASENATENQFDPNAERDSSFRDHNQIRLYLNFGASEVQVAPVMDVPNVTPLQLFMDMPADIDGAGAATKYVQSCWDAQSTLAEMVQVKALIAQGDENLRQNGVIVPDLPHYIANDKIDTTPCDFSSQPMVFDPSMVLSAGSVGGVENLYGYDSGMPSDTDADADGEGTPQTGVAGQGATYTDDEGQVHNYYYLHTDYLYPGAVCFEWQGKTFSSGFIDRIGRFGEGGETSSAARYNTYAAWRDSSKSDYANAMPTSVKYDSWRYVDGQIVDMTKAGAAGVGGAVPKLCSDYAAAVNRYLSLKEQYYKKLADILDAENSIQQLAGVMSSNDGKAVQNLWLY